MDAKTLKKLLAKGSERIVLIDVRGSDEVSDEPYFEVPPENYCIIPLLALSVMSPEELTEKIREMRERLLWQDGDIRIVTLCRSGHRSERACQHFSRQGCSFPVESLDGGYGAWIAEGG